MARARPCPRRRVRWAALLPMAAPDASGRRSGRLREQGHGRNAAHLRRVHSGQPRRSAASPGCTRATNAARDRHRRWAQASSARCASTRARWPRSRTQRRWLGYRCARAPSPSSRQRASAPAPHCRAADLRLRRSTWPRRNACTLSASNSLCPPTARAPPHCCRHGTRWATCSVSALPAGAADAAEGGRRRRARAGHAAHAGFSTALLGEKAAMACTVAVEEVITEHYDDQVRARGSRGGCGGFVFVSWHACVACVYSHACTWIVWVARLSSPPPTNAAPYVNGQ
jgi:hypothetical protein